MIWRGGAIAVAVIFLMESFDAPNSFQGGGLFFVAMNFFCIAFAGLRQDGESAS